MALPLWGELEKELDDPETIEEAIGRLIAAHEQDPEAHLGEGESLEEHKSETVIDHPPGSLLPDKWSYGDYDFETSFESLDGFDIVGNLTNSSWPGILADIFDGGGDVASLKINLLGVLIPTTLTVDYLCDVYFYVDSSDDLEVIDIGVSNNAMTTRYLGFRVSGGNLYGVARWSGSEQLTANLGDVSDGTIKFVRVYYDSGANILYFYLNGEQVATMEPAAALQIDNVWSIRGVDNGAESTVLRVYKTYISRGV